MTFSGCSKLRQTGSHMAAVEVSSCVISEEAGECRLWKNSRQRQNKINQHASQINSLEAQNNKLGQLLEPIFLVETITQAVGSSLKMDETTKLDSSPSGFTSKPTWESHIHHNWPRCGCSRDPALTCWYCKDTSHLKENCIKLTWWLVLDNQEPSNGGARKFDIDTTKK